MVSDRMIFPDRDRDGLATKDPSQVTEPNDVQVLFDQRGQFMLLRAMNRGKPCRPFTFPAWINHIHRFVEEERWNIIRDNKIPGSGDIHGYPPAGSACGARSGIGDARCLSHFLHHIPMGSLIM